MKISAAILVWAILLGVFTLWRGNWAMRRANRARTFEPANGQTSSPTSATGEPAGWLARWLFAAGYRTPSATAIFLAWQALAIAVGLLTVLAVYTTDMLPLAMRALAHVPGGVGDLFMPVIAVSPWLALIALASLPALIVRRQRRRRITQIEQDLPIMLELLATLGEAGLGFDAALTRILQSQPDERRPLAEEMRTFQREVLAGRPRVQCLRRLGRRVGVAAFTILISALVQGEQVGAGLADVLRRQAEDQRSRRREQALTLAASLPVKLLFPLVICFLPGIMVATLGPLFYQLLQTVDGIIRVRGLP